MQPEPDSPRPIDKLGPKTELHAKVLSHLLDRLRFSELKMVSFYPRWQYNEKRIQAYIDLPNWEKALKSMNDEGKPPSAVRIVVPYTYSTISTIVTFLGQVFFGRKPLFQVNSYKGENAEAAQTMEKILQQQADHNKLVSVLYQFFQDTQYYNLGILKCFWDVKRAKRTVWKQGTLGPFKLPGKAFPVREDGLVYEGNVVESIDPFLFFPDPRVPLHKVNREGEFVFWRTFSAKYKLQQKEAAGTFAHTKHIGTLPKQDYQGLSNRRIGLVPGSVGIPGAETVSRGSVTDFVQLDEGTVVITPSELGLGDSDEPAHWVFTIANKTQIVRAEPLNLDHGMHPVVVSEPYGGGYGFGNAGIADLVGPLQDLMTWFVNSHIQNVRIVLNDMFLIDPSRIEMQDVENMGPARRIRLKRAAFGQDIRGAIQQLPVQDVTRAHMADLQLTMNLADTLSGVSDNLRGIQDSGGRKTATEVRTSAEAGSSRLASLARTISSQALVDLTTQMSVNTQQLLSEKMMIAVVGEDGKQKSIRVGASSVVGDFSFPVNDGTLPIDRVAMLDVWKEIFLGVSQDPELARRFDRVALFEFIAELGGAQNISKFIVQSQPDAQVAADAQAGNLAPLGPLPGLKTGGAPTPGVVPNPGARLAGGQ